MLGPAHLVLAHQGGWDELAFVLLPVGVFGYLLWRANRRAATQAAALVGDDPGSGIDSADPETK